MADGGNARGPPAFDCCVVQHEGELVVQPMFCISQTASLCLSLSLGCLLKSPLALPKAPWQQGVGSEGGTRGQNT